LSAAPIPSSVEAEIRALLQQRQKIAAIKLLRQNTGLDLKQAKDAVDALELGMGLPATPAVSPLTLMAVVVVTALVAWWWLAR
jgi:hypothetical protein